MEKQRLFRKCMETMRINSGRRGHFIFICMRIQARSLILWVMSLSLKCIYAVSFLSAIDPPKMLRIIIPIIQRIILQIDTVQFSHERAGVACIRYSGIFCDVVRIRINFKITPSFYFLISYIMNSLMP